jgi:hypothetical protein
MAVRATQSLGFVVVLLLRSFGFGQSASSIFLQPLTYPSGGELAASVALADVNGDGKLDLVATNQCLSYASCGGVAVLLGNGDGTFRPPLAYILGVNAGPVVVADVNGDGKPDLVIGLSYSANLCTPGTVSVMLGNGDGTFQSPVSYNSGGNGNSNVAVADVNGDGKPDIVSANYFGGGGCTGSPGGVAVLLGNGDGTFQSPVAYSSGGSEAIAVAVADVNGDGKPDLLVANPCPAGYCQGYGDGVVGMLLGNGDGTFQSPVAFSSGGVYAEALAVADVNEDGKPDVIVRNLCSSNGPCAEEAVTVLLGNGDGTFQNAASYSSRGYEQILAGFSVDVADVNGDGKPDIVVTTGNTNGMAAVLLGNGDGTFRPAADYSTAGNTPTALALGDVNGDGKADVVVANDYAGMIAVLLGNGDGTFQSGSLLTESLGPGLAVGDFNRDGNLDLVVNNNGNLDVLLGLANGSFQPQAVYFDEGGNYTPLNPGGSVAVADLNRDGWPDIVSVTPLNVQYDPDFGFTLYNTNSYVNVLLNNGNGTFPQNATVFYSYAWDSEGVVLADFNGDGYPDVAVADLCLTPGGDNAASCFGELVTGQPITHNGSINVLFGSGNGTLSSAQNCYSGGGQFYSIAAADVNQDGYADLIFTGDSPPGSGSFLNVMLWDPTAGSFLAPVQYQSGPATSTSPPWAVAVADVNHDGIPDLIVANGNNSGGSGSANGSIAVFLGNGDGTFAAQILTASPPVGSGRPDLAIADFNGDGNLDVASPFGLILGNGDGSFQPPLYLPFGSTGGIVAGDFYGNGRPDLVLSGADGTFLVPNIASNFTHYPTATSISSTPNIAAVGQGVTFVATVTGSKGAIPTGNVLFRIDRGYPAAAPLADGQASYTTTFGANGVHSATAFYPGDANNASSYSSTLIEEIQAVITFSGSPQQPLTKDAKGNFVAKVTLTNTGNVAVSSVQVTSATLGSGALLSPPPAVTNLAPGQSAVVTLTFPSKAASSTATSAALKVSGTYSVTSPALNGNWSLSFRTVTL